MVKDCHTQLYLELADAYKERFMSQNGQVAVLKCSPILKKMRKSFKTLSELKFKFIPKSAANLNLNYFWAACGMNLKLHDFY